MAHMIQPDRAEATGGTHIHECPARRGRRDPRRSGRSARGAVEAPACRADGRAGERRARAEAAGFHAAGPSAAGRTADTPSADAPAQP